MRSPEPVVLTCVDLAGGGRWELERCCSECHGGGCRGASALVTALGAEIEACCTLLVFLTR